MWVEKSEYSKISLIQINWDCEPSGYAKNPDNWNFIWKQVTLAVWWQFQNYSTLVSCFFNKYHTNVRAMNFTDQHSCRFGVNVLYKVSCKAVSKGFCCHPTIFSHSICNSEIFFPNWCHPGVRHISAFESSRFGICLGKALTFYVCMHHICKKYTVLWLKTSPVMTK